MQILILTILTIALPIAWIIADFKSRPNVRRTLGLLAILWSFGVATLVGILQDMSASTYYSSASKDLLHASVEALGAGRTESVIRAWSKADNAYAPSYESRAKYRKVVDEALDDMKK